MSVCGELHPNADADTVQMFGEELIVGVREYLLEKARDCIDNPLHYYALADDLTEEYNLQD
jgi:hypothetical protein